MGKKRTPQTAIQYAAYLYMADRCDNKPRTLTDAAIIDSRIRAFMDGVKWERRRKRTSTARDKP
jgi:hypothetical protein